MVAMAAPPAPIVRDDELTEKPAGGAGDAVSSSLHALRVTTMKNAESRTRVGVTWYMGISGVVEVVWVGRIGYTTGPASS
jgi:hypothetical protein